MYATGIIDVLTWDKAKWKGTVFGWGASDAQPIFLGLFFTDGNAGKEIFQQWRKYIGGEDFYEQIRIAIIEGDIEGEPPGYTVHIGANLRTAFDLAEIRGRRPLEGQMLSVSRFCRMTPPPRSLNLPTFKEKYQKRKEFLLVPVDGSERELHPCFELAILKRTIEWRNVIDIGDNDVDRVVLKTPVPKSQGGGIESGESGAGNLTAKIALFEAELAAGNVPPPLDPMVLDRLAKIQRDHRGQVIPETVDPSLYVLAVNVADKVMERTARSVPLREIQNHYFEILRGIFEQPYSEMMKHQVSPHLVAEQMAESESIVKAVAEDAEGWFQSVKDFWHTAGYIMVAHLQSMRTLKTVYGGNVFPHQQSDLTSNVALYADTIVLPDPLLGSLFMHKATAPKKFAYVVIKNALNAMRYRELATSDLEVPIVAIAPSYFFLEKKATQLISDMSEIDACRHCERIFGREFDTFAAVREFVGGLRDSAALVAAVRDDRRVIVDIEEPPMLLDQIAILEQDMQEFMRRESGAPTGNLALVGSFLGRFMQSNTCLAHCDLYGGIPLIDAPTSWQYLLWKFEYAATTLPDDNRDVFIQHALHSGLKDFPLLQNVPASAVIEMRRNGGMEKMRSMFREGIAAIREANNDTVQEVAEKVAQNLRSAVKEYQTLAAEVAKKKGGVALTGSLVAGRAGLVVAAACTGYFSLALTAAAWGVAGFPSVKDVVSKRKELGRANEALRQSPVGLFWQNQKRTT